MAQTPLLGAIFMFAGNFAPQGYQFCNGQVLSIAQYTALFSIIGTYYGGNGTSTFQLPDFRGRVPISQGQGPGLSTYVIGESTGEENHQLLANEMPVHNHLITSSNQQTSDTASGNYPAAGGAYASALSSPSQLAAQTVTTAGGNVPHTNLQPLLTVSFIIAMTGVFPSRN